MGNLTDKVVLWWGIDLFVDGVRKIEPEVSGVKRFSPFVFTGAAVGNSYKHGFGQDGID